MKIHPTVAMLARISSLVAVVSLSGCVANPRDGQFYPGGPTAAIRFTGFIRSADTEVVVTAFNPSTRIFDPVANVRSNLNATDCDVAGQCWFQYTVDKVLARKYWVDIGAGKLRATISTSAPTSQVDNMMATFPVGAATDQCISDTYRRSGGVQTALSCGGGFQASITTCKVAPCSQ